MMTKKSKQIDLDLRNIKFPTSAIASISHRISGVIIFIMIGIFLFVLKLSLTSTEHFYKIKEIINNFTIKCIILNFLIFFIYHFLNGIRHILMDMGYLNTTLQLGKKSANITFLLTGIFSIIVGFLLL